MHCPLLCIYTAQCYALLAISAPIITCLLIMYPEETVAYISMEAGGNSEHNQDDFYRTGNEIDI